ncbi:Secreted hydrolase-like protein [Apiospora saccharicola]|uniref:Secreted hydrolase-like protein n=1 Tax=Apiospora saccharicola TaxID=335842 RepID=A0ABR1WJW3_9PEZI
MFTQYQTPDTWNRKLERAMAFKRTTDDVHPSATEYTAKTGQYDLFTTLVTPPDRPTYYSSYWLVFFLHGSNGYDYFAVGHVVAYTHCTPPKPLFRVCLLDIHDGYWFGESFPTLDSPFQLDAVDFRSDRFELYASSSPGKDSLVCKSRVAGAEFDLVVSPRGPNLYAGGPGTFFWGTDWTYQMSYPEMWVTGTLQYQGETIEVVPQKSMAWLDRQYGVGTGTAGWDLYMLLFENGLKMSIWRSEACAGVEGATKKYMATVVYPDDGHHEIYPLDDDCVESSRPFVSDETGYLYHAHQVITIPGLDARIEMEQPWPVGEMVVKGNPDVVSTLFEGYVDVLEYFTARLTDQEAIKA